MTTALNISIEPALMATIVATLKTAELGRLMRAVSAAMTGEDEATVQQPLNNSGLRLAFALLQPSIADARERLASNRANGARGGRPRKDARPAAGEPAAASDEEAQKGVLTKKSKKETLPPTPPIKEKNKKNNFSLSSPARDEETGGLPAVAAVCPIEELQQRLLGEQPWLDELCMSRRIRAEDMSRYIADFVNYLRERDMTESLSQAKVHFVNQLPFIIKKYQLQSNNQYHETHQKFIADPVARRRFEQECRRQEVCRAIAELTAESQRPAVIPF